MDKDTLNARREEGVRLWRVCKDIFVYMQSAKGFLPAGQPNDEKQVSFSQESIVQHIALTEEEIEKLKELELVVAAVGTMKAGKSTTINAIIGVDVLPSRNTAMTSLPTRIRHKKGQHKPLLSLPDTSVTVIAELISKLNPHLRKKLSDPSLPPDDRKTYEQLAQYHKVANSYEGASGIFDFLKILNDLVRACTTFSENFPYAAFDELAKLPLVEVEFASLVGLEDQGVGSLTLLDTPGPNEAGQPIIRQMMREQLKKASALITILDYTQLNSDADAELRREVLNLASTLEDRLNIVVNKFDQRDSNSLSEQDLRHFVSSTLLKGKIVPEAVYPICAQYAYLAYRALKELKVAPVLPPCKDAPWVQDFAKLAFGMGASQSLGNRDKEIEGANKLLEYSLFEKPLQVIIHTSYANAALWSLNAALGRLKEIGPKLSDFAQNREQGLLAETESIRKAINDLQNNLQDLDTHKQRALKKKEEELLNFEKILKEELAKQTNHLKEEVKAHFKTRQFSQKLDPHSSIMRFTCKKEAQDLLNSIVQHIQYLSSNAKNALEKNIHSRMNDVLNNFSQQLVLDTQKWLENVTKDMKKSDLAINIAPLSVSALQFDFNPHYFMDDIIQSEEKTVTYRKRQSGLWGWVCEKFDTSDWGWEDVPGKESEYLVNIDALCQLSIKACEHLFPNAKQVFDAHIRQPLEKSIKAFFEQLSTKVEQVRGDLQAGLDDRNSDHKSIEGMCEAAREVAKKAKTLQADIKIFEEELEKIRA